MVGREAVRAERDRRVGQPGAQAVHVLAGDPLHAGLLELGLRIDHEAVQVKLAHPLDRLVRLIDRVVAIDVLPAPRLDLALAQRFDQRNDQVAPGFRVQVVGAAAIGDLDDRVGELRFGGQVGDRLHIAALTVADLPDEVSFSLQFDVFHCLIATLFPCGYWIFWDFLIMFWTLAVSGRSTIAPPGVTQLLTLPGPM